MDPQNQPPFNSTDHCFILNITVSNGIWHADNPFTESLPYFVVQLATVLILNRILFLLLKPFRQPHVVADILSGILLGPSLLGKTVIFPHLFPTKDIVIVETVAYMAVVFHVFLVGLELDITSMVCSTSKAVAFSLAGVLTPFVTGIGFFYLSQALKTHTSELNLKISIQGCILWATALTITSFPVVAQILSSLKLRHSEIGRLGMSTALLSYVGNWILIAFVLPLCVNPKNAPYVMTSTMAFILASIYMIRPLLNMIINRSSDRKSRQYYSDYYLCFVLVGALLSAFVADVAGTHSVVGAFVFGLIMPKSDLGILLINRFDYFVSRLLMPLFFVASGIRVDVSKIQMHWWLLVIVIILLCLVKVLIALLISFFFNIPRRDGVVVGLLMSTKEVLAIIVINTAWDRGVLQGDDYSIMVLALLTMTGIVAPMISVIYNRNNPPVQYKRRSLQGARADAEVRMLTCIYSLDNVQGIIQLLDFARATKQTVSVFALHLVELRGCASRMLIVHGTKRTSSISQRDNIPESDQIVNLLGNYEEENPSISIQAFTTLSPSDHMHEDIRSLCEDKRVALMIIPFHKQLMPDGHLEETNSAHRSINQSVLSSAPCSVGIFVDRGLGVAKEMKMHRVAVIFIGGPDDREALTYGWRMVGNLEIRLTVFLFLFNGDVVETKHNDSSDSIPSLQPLSSFIYRQKQIDDEYVNEFRLRTAGEESVDFEEKIVNNREGLRTALKEKEDKFELFIVGRGAGMASPLTATLDNFSDCPELGVVGDLLASSNSSFGSSVLVVQQYSGLPGGGPVKSISSTSSQSMHSSKEAELGMSRQCNSIGSNEGRGFEAYVKHKRRYDEDDNGSDDD
ncbi:hypothetical protein SLE2022_305560 [Rubroshorea leprosula]